jgi:hypothetical protein
VSTRHINKLTAEVRQLRIQNARLRELVEQLSSRTALLSQRAGSGGVEQLKINVFETFADRQPPRPRGYRGLSIDGDGYSPVRDSGWFPFFDDGIPPLDPNPGWKCQSAHGAPFRVGFKVLGLEGEQLERIVERVEQRQLRHRGFIPVFVTDTTDFKAFRSRGYVFEHIPSVITTSPPNRRTERRYLRRRLEIIKAKWGLGELVDLAP